MMNPILLASILIIPLFFLLLGIRSSISQKAAARLPSPPRLPFIGNLHQVGPIPHHSLYKLSKEYGPLMLLHLGTIRTLVVSSPKIAEEVIKNNDLAFATRPMTKVVTALSYIKSGVAFAEYGESWRQMRKLAVTYLLSSKRLKSMSFNRTEEVSLMLKEVVDAASRGNGVICLTDILDTYVTNVITKVVLGPWVSEETKKVFSELAHDAASLLSQVYFEDLFPNLKWLDVLWGLEGKLQNYRKNWDALFEEIIENHSINSKETNHKNSTYLIDVLLELQNDSSMGFALTRDHIKAIISDMITAGIDTTFIGLDWCMTELIRNPEVMRKVKEEVRGIANGDDIISEEQLSQMNYLKAYIKEAFRLHPPSPLSVPRESMKECQILGYNIPKKTRLLINVWAFGRDESNWEEPEQLKPERFLDSTIDYKGNFTFMPFGSGCRICPGMPFAKIIIELAVANLLLRFDWSLPSGTTSEDMNMEETGGIVAQRKQKLELVPTAIKVY